MEWSSAIIMFLYGGGLLVPLAALGSLAVILGPLAVPVALLLQATGVACLVYAKWPELSAGHYFSFGARRLSPSGRRFYWLAYILIVCGLLLSVFAVPAR
jgi:hypothetical protein